MRKKRKEKEKQGLPRDVQLALGEQLREAYSGFVGRLPWNLISLARRVKDDPSEGQARAEPIVDNMGLVDRAVFDPATIAILQSAFEKAWSDLQSLRHNPSSREALALRLMALVNEGERNPSRLATKAVLISIAPPTAGRDQTGGEPQGSGEK
jgi:hypothetical protein